MLARVPVIIKTLLAYFAAMIAVPSAVAGSILIWEHDFGHAAVVIGIAALSFYVVWAWRQYWLRPIGPVSGASGDFQTTLVWIVAGFFAVGGVVSSMLHDYNNALVELGIAAVALLVIWLRRPKR